MPTVPPLLKTPEIWKHKSLLERILTKMPFISMIGGLMENHRFCYARQELYEQVASRKNTWIPMDESSVSIQIASIFMHELGWANNYFLYDDPLELIVFDDEQWFEGRFVGLISEIENLFNLPEGTIDKHFFHKDEKLSRVVLTPNVTFGDFVRYVFSNMNTRILTR